MVCWLINFITVSGFKDKVVSLFKTNTPKQTMHGTGMKLSKPTIQKQFEENIINNIKIFLYHKKKIKKLKIE